VEGHRTSSNWGEPGLTVSLALAAHIEIKSKITTVIPMTQPREELSFVPLSACLYAL
jgi:hypothetical protein